MAFQISVQPNPRSAPACRLAGTILRAASHTGSSQRQSLPHQARNRHSGRRRDMGPPRQASTRLQGCLSWARVKTLEASHTGHQAGKKWSRSRRSPQPSGQQCHLLDMARQLEWCSLRSNIRQQREQHSLSTILKAS